MFNNFDRGRQLVLFDGIKYGRMMPTDFDAVIEYKNLMWIIFEVKSEGKALPKGQRLSLERFIKDVKKAGKHGIVIVAEHNETDPLKSVIMANCKVREVYTTEGLHWDKLDRPFRAKEIADSYIKYYEQ